MKESQWVEVLRETKLSSVMTRKVAEAICLEHDTRGDGSLDYASFCDDIFAGDFDHYSHQQHFIYKARLLWGVPSWLVTQGMIGCFPLLTLTLSPPC